MAGLSASACADSVSTAKFLTRQGASRRLVPILNQPRLTASGIQLGENVGFFQHRDLNSLDSDVGLSVWCRMAAPRARGPWRAPTIGVV